MEFSAISQRPPVRSWLLPPRFEKFRKQQTPTC